MTPKLSAIADKAAENLKAQILESDAKIMEAWAAASEEAVLNEVEAKFRMGFAINLNLDRNSMTTDLTFGTRHKLTANCSIPDPNQAELTI